MAFHDSSSLIDNDLSLLIFTDNNEKQATSSPIIFTLVPSYKCQIGTTLFLSISFLFTFHFTVILKRKCHPLKTFNSKVI